MKHEVVKFSNGLYGIRRTGFWAKILGLQNSFLDLVSNGRFYWTVQSRFFEDCCALSKEEAFAKLKRLEVHVEKIVDMNLMMKTEKTDNRQV